MIIRRFVLILYIIMCSLPCMLPVAAVGQTAAFDAPSRRSAAPRVPPKVGDSWYDLLTDGGMLRRGGCYCQMANGLSDLMVMNFVDGYSYGPHATLGYIAPSRNRWEVEETVRWASGRHAWLAKGALRWMSPAESGVTVEVFGGRHTEDFDHDPTMPTSHSLMATGLFGWNHYKLLERTDAGIRLTMPLCAAMDVTFKGSWERRRAMTNHKNRNVFGVKAQDNVPRLRKGSSASDLVDYAGPIDGELALFSLQLNYQGDRRLYVYDDMTSWMESDNPLISFQADAGLGQWHYLSLGLSVRQTLALPNSDDHLRYIFSGGTIFKHGSIGLADWHHLDASRFWWQSSEQLSRFVMLDNYELSTDRAWLEGHLEWYSGSHMLSTRLIRMPDVISEYIQLHFVKVPTHPAHFELQYGVDLARCWRLGVAVGYDGTSCRGVAFTMSLDLQAGRELKKKTDTL